MEERKSEKKGKRKSVLARPDVRSLKVHHKYRENVYSKIHEPEIRLRGGWLGELGFLVGKRVVVTTMKELLIITIQPEEGKSQ